MYRNAPTTSVAAIRAHRQPTTTGMGEVTPKVSCPGRVADMSGMHLPCSPYAAGGILFTVGTHLVELQALSVSP